MKEAAGHLHVLKWIYENLHDGSPIRSEVLRYAVSAGNLDSIKWLHEKGCPLDDFHVSMAAWRSHWEVVNWLLANGVTLKLACRGFAKNGNLEYMKKWFEEGLPFPTDTGVFISDSGNLDLLKWANEHNLDLTPSMYLFSVQRGDYAMLEWLQEQGVPFCDNVIGIAAEKGDIDLLNWLLERGAPLLEEACLGATEEGNFEALKWLDDHDCPWDFFSLTRKATAFGRLDILKWVCEEIEWDKKYEIDSDVIPQAAANGHIEILKYVRQRQGITSLYVLPGAFESENYSVVRWGMRAGLPIGRCLKNDWELAGLDHLYYGD